MPSVTISTQATLFDLDGTLIFSTKAVTRAWTAFFKTNNLPLDPNFFHDTHGMRTLEAFKKYFPMIDDAGGEKSAAFDLTIAEDYGQLAEPIVGGPKLIQSIPHDRWCVVTSGTRGIAHAWFDKVLIRNRLPKPIVFLTSNDVNFGKPHPEPYLKGALEISKQLGHKVDNAVVFEDAPTGIKAGVAAGFPVIAIMSTFDSKTLYDSGASYVVEDLSHVQVKEILEDGLVLEIDYVEKA